VWEALLPARPERTSLLDDFIQRFRLQGYEPWRGRKI